MSQIRRPNRLVLSLALLLTVLLPLIAAADDGNLLQQGNMTPQSVGALAFGPDNILYVGDSLGAAVYALEVQPPASDAEPKAVEDLDGQIAAMLGTTARNIFVQDMTVHRQSGTAYLSITRGQGDDALPVLASVSSAGDIAILSLDAVRHARLAIDNAPNKDAKLYRWESRSFTITDLEYIDGELFIAGLSNEEFASNLRRTRFPFSQDMEITRLEIYHGAHGEYETFAPIFSFIPYEIDGKTHLLAGYLCTPLVTFPLDDIRSQSKLRGKTIAELGWGNTPTDMVAYQKGDEGYVLIANNRRGTMRVKASDIIAAHKGKGITEEVGPRTGVDDETVPIGNVSHLAPLNNDTILMLGRSMENGALYLMPAPTRRL